MVSVSLSEGKNYLLLSPHHQFPSEQLSCLTMAFCTEGLQFDPSTDSLLTASRNSTGFSPSITHKTQKRILTCQHTAPHVGSTTCGALGQQFYHWPQENLTGLFLSRSMSGKTKINAHKQDRMSLCSLRSFSCPVVLRGHIHWKAWLVGTQPLCPYSH